MNYRRFEHDLYRGCRLSMMQSFHLARGFRGKAKGTGFRAYLKAENIPARKAYRLIERYRRMQGILDRAERRNAALEEKLFPLPSLEMVAELRAELQAIRDSDPDTNERETA